MASLTPMGSKRDDLQFSPDYLPWDNSFSDRDAPYYRWYEGGFTNACFNEVDAHVLNGHGDETALIFESEHWEGEDARGRPQTVRKVSRRELLIEVVHAALVLKELGLTQGDRIVFYMPNTPEHIFFIEAAKRLGVIYTCVFGGLSPKTLAERILDTKAKVVITCNKFAKNGQTLNAKTEFVDIALEQLADRPRVLTIGSPEPGGYIDLLKRASNALAGAVEDAVESAPNAQLIKGIYALIPPIPVSADFPLFLAYTSGSTGKPKGAVHTHGGFVAGIAHTMRVCFGVEAGVDTIYTVADPGWITGQSYMISAPLVSRVTSVVAEGGPLFPFSTRFASVIERHQVTILKAGSTFLRAVVGEKESARHLKNYDLTSLRAGSFCAEPVSPATQKFAMENLAPYYINSYWATEHGGIVLTHFFENPDFKLRADAHCLPMPWIFAEVRVQTEGTNYRLAEIGERGELVIAQPYPYLARTLWGDSDNVLSESWKGDIERFSKNYFQRWGELDSGEWVYTQGDFACQYEDGSFTLHGRSDDVINTSGHRIGTEEIEGAILKDKMVTPGSPVANVIVIGAPDEQRGQVPVAFIRLHPGRKLSLDDEVRLNKLVVQEKGEVALPAAYLTVSQFPETRSGKYIRRYLKAILNKEELGDTSTLVNPASIDELRGIINKWQARSGPVSLSENDEETVAKLRCTTEPLTLRPLLEAAIAREVSRLLNLETGVCVDPQGDLMLYGVNSLSAVKLRNRMQTLFLRTGETLPTNIVFNFPTIASLAEYLTAKLTGATTGKGALKESDNNLDLASDVFAPREAYFRWSAPRKILLTGATGFLGAYLLDELLRQTDAQIHCLVRFGAGESGEQRIAAALKSQGIDQPLTSRVIAVSGDLTQPKLGMNAKSYKDLAASVDTIYHAGALVNHVYPYSALKQANVGGTEEVLRFATVGRLKMVHKISTIGVFLGESHSGKYVSEWSFPQSMDDLADGYCKAKWASEKLVRIGLQRGIPAAIYRPGDISWHQTTGFFNPADYTVNLLRLCLAMGVAPDLKMYFDLAPIDYVAGGIIALSLTSSSLNQTYSLTNPNLILLPDLVRILQTLGCKINTVPLPLWLEALDAPELSDDRFAVTCRNYYADEKGEVSGQLSEAPMPHFDVYNTSQGLRSTGIACPIVGSEYLKKFLSRLKSV